MMAVIAAPFALTLMTVTRPRTPLDLAENPTPLGYTWSLSLFILPTLVLASWLGRRPESRVQNLSFWITAGFVAVSGILLDVFFALSFFTFPGNAKLDCACGLRRIGSPLSRMAPPKKQLRSFAQMAADTIESNRRMMQYLQDSKILNPTRIVLVQPR
jgi:hypothetical protein